MPMIAPSYASGPFELRNREHIVFRYRTDPEAIARALPEPLIPNEKDEVFIMFSQTEGAGLGQYHKCDMYIPAYYKGEYVHYGVQSYVDSSATRTAGREVYGLPSKIGFPTIEVKKDTIITKLKYGEEEIAMGTMTYHHKSLAQSDAKSFLKVPLVNLKLIPSAKQGEVDVAKLTQYHYEDVQIKSAHVGPSRIELTPHVNAPLADLPVLEILEGIMIVADVNMSKATPLYDYKTQKSYHVHH
jgi:acetoacetate decarboxylase